MGTGSKDPLFGISKVNEHIRPLVESFLQTPQTLSQAVDRVVATLSTAAFKLPMSLANESMHLFGNGIFKKLLELWFENSSKHRLSNDAQKEIDRRLSQQRLPSFFRRQVRQISSNFSALKANEILYLFFYFAEAIFQGVLRDELFQIVVGISSIVRELWGSRIKRSRLPNIAVELRVLGLRLERYFGAGIMSANFHDLQHHVADNVECLGPLWTVSTFGFEEFNHLLISCILGNTFVEESAVNTVASLQSIEFLRPLVTSVEIQNALQRFEARSSNQEGSRVPRGWHRVNVEGRQVQSEQTLDFQATYWIGKNQSPESMTVANVTANQNWENDDAEEFEDTEEDEDTDSFDNTVSSPHNDEEDAPAATIPSNSIQVICTFDTLFHKGVLLQSSHKQRKQKACNYVVSFALPETEPQFGEILYFQLVRASSGRECVIIKVCPIPSVEQEIGGTAERNPTPIFIKDSMLIDIAVGVRIPSGRVWRLCGRNLATPCHGLLM